jgi:hypothetical protein
VRLSIILPGLLFLGGSLLAQRIRVREVPEISMPGQVDSNSPGFWVGNQFHLLNSVGAGPVVSAGTDQFHLSNPEPIRFPHQNNWPTWMEATWADGNGAVFAWYHQEHFGVCPGSGLSVPQIGAAISHDGGRTFQDQGIVLSSGDPIDCSSQNGYFAGGHGDFSVILDRDRNYFYFLFSNYAGPAASQGVALARLDFNNRYSPAGNVWKYFGGGWEERGAGGRVTPIFPAAVGWQEQDTNAYWGPSIHWNTHLGAYVMLLNRACCSPGWPQQGIYASFTTDLTNPFAWSAPRKILSEGGWYPQVLGIGAGRTDTVAGRVARLYIFGHSRWELVFEKAAEGAGPT